MLKQTPFITIVIAAVLSIITIALIDNPERPLTEAQSLLFFIVALLPSFGIALLFDPFSRDKKAEYLKVNFYEEKEQ